MTTPQDGDAPAPQAAPAAPARPQTEDALPEILTTLRRMQDRLTRLEIERNDLLDDEKEPGVARRMVDSQKFWMVVIACVLVAANDRLHLGLSSETVGWIAGLLGAGAISQGIADAGKERVKAEAAIAKKTKV